MSEELDLDEVSQSFKSKLSNFWYYNWKKVVFVVVLIIIIFLGLRSCMNVVRPDLNVILAGNFFLDDTMEKRLESDFSLYTPDVNGDGVSKCSIIVLNLSDQLRAENYNLANSMQAKMTVEIVSGETYVFILDSDTYKFYKNKVESPLFLPFKDVIGIEGNDGYSLPLSETAIYKCFSFLKPEIPDGLTISFKIKSFMNDKEKQKLYDGAKQFIYNIYSQNLLAKK